MRFEVGQTYKTTGYSLMLVKERNADRLTIGFLTQLDFNIRNYLLSKGAVVDFSCLEEYSCQVHDDNGVEYTIVHGTTSHADSIVVYKGSPE